MFRSKKGAEGFGMAIVVTLVLIAVGVILFYPFISAMASYIKGGGSEAACTLSLFKGEGTAKCPIDEVKIFDDQVRTYDEKVNLENADKSDGKKFVDRNKIKNRLTNDMANEAFAKLLEICLRRGGGYDSRAFSSETYIADETVCLECFNVYIDETAGEIKDLTDYLRETKVKGISSDKKYLDILTKDDSHLRAYMEFGLEKGLAPSESTFVFEPKKYYTIFFIGVKKGKLTKKWEKIKDAATLDFLNLFFEEHDKYFTYIVESNRLGEVCKRKVN